MSAESEYISFNATTGEFMRGGRNLIVNKAGFIRSSAGFSAPQNEILILRPRWRNSQTTNLRAKITGSFSARCPSSSSRGPRMKHFDPIRAQTEWCRELPILERARRGIRAIQQRIANPDMREDVRENDRRQLKHWRGILLRGGR